MRKIILSCAAFASVIAFLSAPSARSQQPQAPRNVEKVKGYGTHFQPPRRGAPCHNGISTPTGEDISIGVNWRTSMMANAGRDPYWMAGVRRELIDHPSAAAHIQDECTICHMPMMRYEAKLAGGQGEPFAHLPPNLGKPADKLADDGVSCAVCHQITDQ